MEKKSRLTDLANFSSQLLELMNENAMLMKHTTLPDGTAHYIFIPNTYKKVNITYYKRIERYFKNPQLFKEKEKAKVKAKKLDLKNPNYGFEFKGIEIFIKKDIQTSIRTIRNEFNYCKYGRGRINPTVINRSKSAFCFSINGVFTFLGGIKYIRRLTFDQVAKYGLSISPVEKFNKIIGNFIKNYFLSGIVRASEIPFLRNGEDIADIVANFKYPSLASVQACKNLHAIYELTTNLKLPKNIFVKFPFIRELLHLSQLIEPDNFVLLNNCKMDEKLVKIVEKHTYGWSGNVKLTVCILEKLKIEANNVDIRKVRLILDFLRLLHLENIRFDFAIVSLSYIRRIHDELTVRLNERKYQISQYEKSLQIIQKFELPESFLSIELLDSYSRYILEGTSMHHCVASYWDAAKELKFVVYRIKYENVDYTVQLKTENFEIIQIHGRYNRNPTSTVYKSIQKELFRICETLPKSEGFELKSISEKGSYRIL